MKLHDGVGYATLPKELRGKRNMVVKDVAKRDGGRFRSEVGKRREDVS
jgi:PAB-dependent poly(A)-specific ribonuclease subunit 2